MEAAYRHRLTPENADPIWLSSAAGSIAISALAFVVGPRLVPKLLQPYAHLTYRNRRDQESSGCRYIGFVHAVIVTVLNFYILLATDVFDDSQGKSPVPLVKRTSVLTYTSLGFSLGYFLVDALLVTWFMPAMGGLEMVAHHVAAFCSVLTTVVFHETHMYTLVLLATECTTPFINFRWLLEKMGWKETVWYKANGIALTISWFVARVAMFFWFYTHLYHRRQQIWLLHWTSAFCLLTVPAMLAVLNLVWFSKILKGMLRAFGGRKWLKEMTEYKYGEMQDHHLTNGCKHE